MRASQFVPWIVCGLLVIVPSASAQTAPQDRIQLTLDTSEADQIPAILALRQADKPVPAEEWQKLFATAPYQRLKEREKKIGEQFHDPSVVFNDEDFKKFVLSDDLLRQAPQLKATLECWKQANLNHSAEHVLAYLPEVAVIRAKVYPVIKPGVNSFVWRLTTDPTIFLYLDPELTREKFENIVDHELHHIGLGSLGPVYTQKTAALPPRARAAAEWMEPFGEGLAMLAAAGGPDVDPHAPSTHKEHSRWEAELSSFNSDLPTVNNFYLDILNGKLADNDAIETKGTSFFGSQQGPWYTVGYKMAVMVEKRYGRAVLVRSMLDFRCLLALYNQAATEENAVGKQHLPLWSETVLAQVEAGTCGVTASNPKPAPQNSSTTFTGRFAVSITLRYSSSRVVRNC